MADLYGSRDPYTLSQLLAALGARLVIPAQDYLTVCPVCQGRWTEPSWGGRPSLCLPCTVAEIGEPLDELAQRVTARKTRAQFAQLPRDDDGRAIFTPRRNRWGGGT